MFHPAINKFSKFRYQSDLSKKRYSFLHTENSNFSLKELDEYKNCTLELSLINFNDDNKHSDAVLYYANNINNENGSLIIKIQSNEIKFDCIGIERLKKSGKNVSNNLDSTNSAKMRENCRILARIHNPQTNETSLIKSSIIRNKDGGVSEKLDILSVGRPKSVESWETVICTLTNNVAFYLDEVELVINNVEILANAEDNTKLQYNTYQFSIPETILQSQYLLKCILQCKSFDKSETFDLSIGTVDNRKRKKCLKRTNDENDLDNERLTSLYDPNTNSETALPTENYFQSSPLYLDERKNTGFSKHSTVAGLNTSTYVDDNIVDVPLRGTSQIDCGNIQSNDNFFNDFSDWENKKELDFENPRTVNDLCFLIDNDYCQSNK